MPRLSVGAGVRTAFYVPQQYDYHRTPLRSSSPECQACRLMISVAMVSLALFPSVCLSFFLSFFLSLSLSLSLSCLAGCARVLFNCCASPFVGSFHARLLVEAVPLSRLLLLPPNPCHVVLPCLSVRYGPHPCGTSHIPLVAKLSLGLSKCTETHVCVVFGCLCMSGLAQGTGRTTVARAAPVSIQYVMADCHLHCVHL
jgi:hypothetical protein